MKEDFLHFVWQFQYFDKSTLKTSEGDEVFILRQGMPNRNSGPDFSDCRIRIRDLDWVGNVEIHYKSSEWIAHQHHYDKAYDNVILHVVWTDDKPVERTDGSRITTVELKHRIPDDLIRKYTQFIQNSHEVLCTSFFQNVTPVAVIAMLDRVLTKRLEDKSEKIRGMLQINSNDWEKTAYQVLAANFGFKLNEQPFSRLSRLLPYNVIVKHTGNLQQLEALLFGMSGLLSGPMTDAYPKYLKKEFEFFRHKYSLQQQPICKSEWKFSKIRPANFPTLRIAQFARFLHKHTPLFSYLLEMRDTKALNEPDGVYESYWSTHYLFDKETPKHSCALGDSSVLNIVINSIVPLMICYSKEKDDHTYQEKAIALLESIPAEKNRIVDMWQSIGLSCNSAYDSQAAIELYNNYCKKKACLQCNIGVTQFKPGRL